MSQWRPWWGSGGLYIMLKLKWIVIGALALSSLHAYADRIDELVAKIKKTPLWENGVFPALKSKKAASTKEVILEYCSMSSFDDGTRIKQIEILEERDVDLKRPGSNFRAAFCKTDQGAFIFILRHSDSHGWWVRRESLVAKE